MVVRSFKPLKSRSFFVFGARGTGKSTWLRKEFLGESSVYFNLLDPNLYEELLLSPQRFKELINQPENRKKVIVVDEVQRVPRLLDIVHDEISHNKRIFVLSGSSARRLKQKGINLLAGRASVYYLHPFSLQELGSDFDLRKALEYGLLPEAYTAKGDEEAKEFLKSYVITYIEKEIQQEQWVRKIEPFRKFLNILAQMNSKIVNKLKIARQIGVQSTTVEGYLEILEDTLLGFRLPGYETSVRKQVMLADKFYFIDTGLCRAIEKALSIDLVEHSSYYGSLFETFIVNEIRKQIEYRRLDWSLSYLRTKDDVEIDLVISRPKNSPILIEVKATNSILPEDAKALLAVGGDLDKKFKSKCPKYLVSKDKASKKIADVENLPYLDINKIFD